MEKLTTTFEKIITEYTKAYDNDDPTAGGWAIFELIKAVKERDRYLLGDLCKYCGSEDFTFYDETPDTYGFCNKCGKAFSKPVSDITIEKIHKRAEESR